ncbi:MAG: hypothetical protein AW07_02776 [Candidatus Accumulibacter sp. SK-11]|nr:MAG: hypothetical protein AW07_02776 [Candidatus Accumulibacter sp. SK-11]
MPPAAWDQALGDTARARPTAADEFPSERSRMKTIRFWMFAPALAIACTSATAALVIDGRQTQLQVSTQIGFVGSVNSATDSRQYSSVTSDLQPRLAGSDSGSGAVGDGSWIANYQYQLDQSIDYLPAGGFSASASVTLFAFAADQGVAAVDAQSGNRLELRFHLNTDESYGFTGITTDLASVILEQSAGSGVWNPLAEPTAGAFQYSLRLAAGQYRFAAVSSGYHDSSQGAGSSWAVQLMTMPEPGSLLLLATAVGVGMVAGRRQRRNE